VKGNWDKKHLRDGPRKVTVHQKLTYRIDEFVNTLINDTQKVELSIEQKTAVLNALGKWVAVKNKLIDGLEGEKLDDFKSRLKKGSSHALGDAIAGPGTTGGGVSTQRVDYAQKSAAARLGGLATARRGLEPLDEPTGLAEFKARIPRADDRDDGGDRDDAGGEVPAADGDAERGAAHLLGD
jgi:hypothetical protein